jgi:nitrite reductase/ring-hydroxylating ferredoxin subunit
MDERDLVRVATYRRRVRATTASIWENVLDWEHLPWLHHTTFSDVRLLDARSTGWRAAVSLTAAAGRRIEIETRLEPEARRYLTLSTDGSDRATAIWTHLRPVDGRHTDIEVHFLVPGVSEAAVNAVGDAYVRLYAQLWDEDEGMMVRRERLLARPAGRAAAGGASIDLGPLADVRARLPLELDLGGGSYRLVEVDGRIIAHATVCPHRLGPLGSAAIEDGCLRCPWHGYRFDLRTGRGRDRRDLRLDPAPEVRVDPRTARVTVRTTAG